MTSSERGGQRSKRGVKERDRGTRQKLAGQPGNVGEGR